MERYLLFACLLAIYLLNWQVLLVAADEKPCTIHDGDKFYNLNPLKARQDYTFKSPSGHEFVINVCGPVVRDTWHLPHPQDVAGFVRRDHGDFSIGVVNTTLGLENGHPLVTLTNGSPCTDAAQINASTVIEFICDTSVFAAGTPELVAQLPPDNDEAACAFVIEWRTHFACPAGEMGGPGGFFAVLAVTFVVVLMIYIVAGTLYNRYALHLRGHHQIPIFSFPFFAAVASWIKNSALNSFDILYHRPGSQRDSILNQHSHQWGVRPQAPSAEEWDSSGRGHGRRPRVPSTIEEEESLVDPESEESDELRQPLDPQKGEHTPSRETGGLPHAGGVDSTGTIYL